MNIYEGVTVNICPPGYAKGYGDQGGLIADLEHLSPQGSSLEKVRENPTGCWIRQNAARKKAVALSKIDKRARNNNRFNTLFDQCRE